MGRHNDWRSKRDAQFYDGHNRKAGASARAQGRHARRFRRQFSRILRDWVEVWEPPPIRHAELTESELVVLLTALLIVNGEDPCPPTT